MPKSSAMTVTIGIMALRKAWRSSTSRSLTPLARAVRMKSWRITAIISARTKRVKPATLSNVSDSTGRTRYCSRSQKPPLPMVSSPPAGSQPSQTAKTKIRISASQKDGAERPAKLNRLTV